ncbi:MAG: DnaA/Hda family protein [Elusimicrobiales bacterium]|nr:DnaA/Hda family protein [Elusimicrobiales bacterium]
MITKWQLVKYPVETDLNRHALFIDGDIKDLRVVMQKLTRIAVSSHKAGAPYSYAVFLANITPQMYETIRRAMPGICQVTEQMNPPAPPPIANDMDFFNKLTQSLINLQNEKSRQSEEESRPEPEEPASPPSAPETGTGRHKQDRPSARQEDEQKLAEDLAEQLSSLQAQQETVPAPDIPDKAPPSQKLYEANPSKTVIAPAAVEAAPPSKPPAKPEAKPRPRPAPPKPELRPAAKPKPEAEIKAEKPKPVPAPAPASAPEPKPQEPSAPEPAAQISKPPEQPAAQENENVALEHKRRKNHRWTIEAPLNPLFTVDSVVTGSHNRAVHAKTASLVDNPGSFFNPYLVHGVSGSGKTHILQAVYYGLEKTLGQGKVLYTNGMRFSKAIRRASAEGSWRALDDEFSAYSAIVIDDIHLMTVDAANRDLVSEALNAFPSNRRQMVAASTFSKRGLAHFEGVWGVRLPGGYEGQVNPPDGTSASEIVTRLIDASGLILTAPEINWFSSTERPLESVQKNISRLQTLKNAMPAFPEENILELIAAHSAVDEMPPSDEVDAAVEFDPPPDNRWGRWGLYYPDGEERLAKYVLAKLRERARQLDMPGWFDKTFSKSYGNPNAWTTPAEMADYCDNQKVKGAIIVGPSMASDFFKAEKDFFQSADRAFGGLAMQAACVGTGTLNTPQAYARLLADILY